MDAEIDQKYTLYTDGACRPNPGSGGWAYFCPELGLEGSGGVANTTNNAMEMTAVLFGIGAMPEHARVKILTDSKMVIGWIARRWKIESNPKIAGIREAIDRLILAKHLVLSMQLVAGHSGDPGNERVDRLASAAIGTHKDPQVFQWLEVAMTIANLDMAAVRALLSTIEKLGGEVTGGEAIAFDGEWNELQRRDIQGNKLE
jgi:ribonuclease HI